jgi:hypothetical protein
MRVQSSRENIGGTRRLKNLMLVARLSSVCSEECYLWRASAEHIAKRQLDFLCFIKFLQK